jgi:hypothetical protein
VTDPLGAYAAQVLGPGSPPPSDDPLGAYAAQVLAHPSAAAQGHLGDYLKAQGAPPGLGPTPPPTSVLQDLLDLAKVTGQNAWAAVGAPAANLMMQVGAPPGPGTSTTADPRTVAAVGPQALMAGAANEVQAAQQRAQDATTQYLSANPTSPLRIAAAGAATAAGQLGPMVAAPFAGAEAAGAAAAERYAGLAESSPTLFRLLVSGAKVAGAAGEGAGYGYANADPTKPLADQLPDIARQAGISALTVGAGEALHGAGAALRGAGAPAWLAGRGTPPPPTPESPATPDAPTAPPGPSTGVSVPPVEPRLGYQIEDRSAPGSAARTLAAVGTDGSAELDYHRAAGGGFHPTDLRPSDPPPDAVRAAFQAASEIEGPHRGDIAPTGPVAEASARVRATDPDVFGDYHADPANRPPPLASEELAAFTPSTTGAVDSPANAGLVAAIGARAAPRPPRLFELPETPIPGQPGTELSINRSARDLARGTEEPYTIPFRQSPEPALPETSGRIPEDAARSALLAGALGDPELAARTLAHADPQVRAIGDAVASVAPTLEVSRAGAAAGELAPVGIQAPLREAMASVEQSGVKGRAGANLSPEASTIASFLRDNAAHPDEIGLGLHRYAELHMLADQASPIGRQELLQAAFDPAERQRAGQILPLEQPIPVHVNAGERGFLSLTSRGPRFGESAPLSRWFTVDGRFAALGDELRGQAKAAVNAKDFRLLAETGRATANVRDFGAAFDPYFKALRRLDPGLDPGPALEHVLDFGRGLHDGADLPPDLRQATLAMRGHFDELAGRALDRPGFLSPGLRETFAGNQGTYWTRTFQRYTDPEGWVKKLETDPAEKWRMDNFIRWATTEHPDWTEDNARGYARKLLLDDPNAFRAATRPQVGGVGRQGREWAIRRLGTEAAEDLAGAGGLPREIDDLLGLHRDPAMSYQLGATRLARDLEVYDLHLKLLAADQRAAAAGERPHLVPLHTDDLPTKIGGNGPLKNFYTSPEIAAIVRGTDATSAAHGALMRSYLMLNGAVKSGKIALNFPMGVMRNLLSWPMQYLAGGHFVDALPGVAHASMFRPRNLALITEANLGTKYGAIAKLNRALISHLSTADGEPLAVGDLRAEIAKLRELGVLGQSATRADLSEYNPLEHGGPPIVRGAIRGLGGAWSAEHDLGKLNYYRAELHNLRWAQPDLPVAEAEQLAAQRTRAVTPTRSEIIPAVREVRKAALVSPFPSWPAEAWRNTKNNLTIGLSDLADDNPRMKILGAKRLAGLSVAAALTAGGMTKGLQMLWGTDQNKADAIRKFLPEYLKENQVAVAERKGGSVRYMNATGLMPMAVWADSLLAAVRGVRAGQPVDGLVDGFEQAARPFMDPEIGIKAAADLAYNQQRRGGLMDQALNPLRPHPLNLKGPQVMTEGAPMSVTLPEAGRYLWHALAPGTALEAERMARAAGVGGLSDVNARGKRYNIPDELAALGGVRFSTLDLNSGLTTAGHDLNDAVGDSKRYFSGQRSGSQNDPRSVLEAKSAANAKYRNAWDQAREKVEAARQLGVPDGAIFGNLAKSGLSPRIVRQLMSGQFQPLSLARPYRAPRDLAGEAGGFGPQ